VYSSCVDNVVARELAGCGASLDGIERHRMSRRPH
jgi:hypothetical protein